VKLTLQLAAAAIIGRRGWVRSIIVAVAALICTMVLLAVFAVPNVIDGESQRFLAQQPRMAKASASSESVGYSDASVNYYGTDRIKQVLLGDPSENPPLPPGISRVPERGEVFLSPALSALMAANPLLAEWFPQTVVGPIAPEGLVSPDQLLVYIGVPANAFHTDYEDHAVGFGAGAHVSATQAGVRWYQVAGFAMLVVIPALAAFLAAARVGVVVRRRRSRALSTAGASAGTIATVGAAEAVLPTLVGAGVGAVLFAWVGPMVTRIPITDRAVESADVRVSALVSAGVVVGLAVVAGLLSATSAYRAAQLDRTNRPSRPRHRVGIAPVFVFGVGVALLVLCVIRAEPRDSLLRPALILTAIGLPTATILLAKFIGRLARPGWPVPALIAFRRLHRDPGAAGTLVAVVAVMTFAVASSIPVIHDKGDSTSWANLVESGYVADTMVVRAESLASALPVEPRIAVPDGADVAMALGVWTPASPPDALPSGRALIATCAQVERLAGEAVKGCSDDAQNLVDRGPGNPTATGFALRTTSGETVEFEGAVNTVLMPDNNNVPIDVDVIISPDNPLVKGSDDLFVTAIYARISTTPTAIEEFRAYAIGAGPAVRVDIADGGMLKVNSLTQWILLGIVLAAGMSLLTVLALSITRARQGSEQALALLAAPSLVRSASSTLSTATAAFAGATLAIGCGLITAIAYAAAGGEPMAGASQYVGLWAVAIVAGIVLGALSEALGRLRTG